MSGQSIHARLLFALSGHSRNGLRLKQVADGIDESQATTLRALQRMEADGLAEQNPRLQGHWRLSALTVQIALAHAAEVAREERELDDFKNRYSRNPN